VDLRTSESSENEREEEHSLPSHLHPLRYSLWIALVEKDIFKAEVLFKNETLLK